MYNPLHELSDDHYTNYIENPIQFALLTLCAKIPTQFYETHASFPYQLEKDVNNNEYTISTRSLSRFSDLIQGLYIYHECDGDVFCLDKVEIIADFCIIDGEQCSMNVIHTIDDINKVVPSRKRTYIPIPQLSNISFTTYTFKLTFKPHPNIHLIDVYASLLMLTTDVRTKIKDGELISIVDNKKWMVYEYYMRCSTNNKPSTSLFNLISSSSPHIKREYSRKTALTYTPFYHMPTKHEIACIPSTTNNVIVVGLPINVIDFDFINDLYVKCNHTCWLGQVEVLASDVVIHTINDYAQVNKSHCVAESRRYVGLPQIPVIACPNTTFSFRLTFTRESVVDEYIKIYAEGYVFENDEVRHKFIHTPTSIVVNGKTWSIGEGCLKIGIYHAVLG